MPGREEVASGTWEIRGSGRGYDPLLYMAFGTRDDGRGFPVCVDENMLKIGDSGTKVFWSIGGADEGSSQERFQKIVDLLGLALKVCRFILELFEHFFWRKESRAYRRLTQYDLYGSVRAAG